MSALDRVDLSVRLTEKQYWKRIAAAQLRLRACMVDLYRRADRSCLVVFEGWDAAGKGGAIKRLTETLDPRSYLVHSVAAPVGEERTHHYLWRFWNRVPPLGRMAVLDRSHYGRVLVERVEGFCSTPEWRRAYREIREWERQLHGAGCLVLKFWLHISPEEQLRRFKARERDPFRRYKLTEEDWRNRARWEPYANAVERMLEWTSTPESPWFVIEAEDKWWARVRVVEAVADHLEQALAGE